MVIPPYEPPMAAVKFTLPPASLFRFPPSSQPAALPPPNNAPTFAQPFNVAPAVYAELLKLQYPVTISILYASAVYFLNRLNRQRGHKPWAVSKTRWFFAAVIVHNVLLALYSGWTFAGMLNAVATAWPGWSSMHSADGWGRVVDAFCKLNGPRGLGDAVTFAPESNQWHARRRAIRLLNGAPDPTDVGRIWNSGLAFYGWLFYLSKFYEVVDTAIILAKGKRSSFLQTYHHAGAMFGMWAGIRYMSPPIWMFVTFNSGIHTLMYTYYTLSALAIPVPLLAKRALTTLQIAQFVVGASYAVLHLFVAYRAPVETPYRFVHNLSTALPSLASTATSAASTALASGDAGAWARKLALRAAGMEGLAQQATNRAGRPFGHDAAHAQQVEQAAEEIRYRAEYASVACIDTSGQAFAILLNVMYLAPLTGLFVRFFVRAYSRRARLDPNARGKAPWQPDIVGPSAGDAAKRVESAVLRAMSRDRGSERGSAYTSPATSEAEGAGGGTRRAKGLEMTRPDDEVKSEPKEDGTAAVKEEPAEDATPKDAEADGGAPAEAQDKPAEEAADGQPASADQTAEPESKAEDVEDDGRSFAKYAASDGKTGEDGAAKPEEPEAKDPSSDDKGEEAGGEKGGSQDKADAGARTLKGPEDSGVLVDMQDKEAE